jgi:hypothetical protein
MSSDAKATVASNYLAFGAIFLFQPVYHLMGGIRYQPHGQWRHLEVDATGQNRVYGWLLVVTVLVGSRARVGLVTPTPNGHLPALFGGPFRVQLGGGCPLDKAVGMNPGLSNREEARLVVFSPQHQTAMDETYN